MSELFVYWVIFVQTVKGAYPDISLRVFAKTVNEVGTNAGGIIGVVYEMGYLFPLYAKCTLTRTCCHPIAAFTVFEDVTDVSIGNKCLQFFGGGKQIKSTISPDEDGIIGYK